MRTSGHWNLLGIRAHIRLEASLFRSPLSLPLNYGFKLRMWFWIKYFVPSWIVSVFMLLGPLITTSLILFLMLVKFLANDFILEFNYSFFSRTILQFQTTASILICWVYHSNLTIIYLIIVDPSFGPAFDNSFYSMIWII